MQDEPVSVSGAISAALIATINVLALIFDWSGDLTSLLNLAAGAWVIAVTVIVRRAVTPNSRVPQ